LNFENLAPSRPRGNYGAHPFALASHVIFPGEKPRFVTL
jgi:hypothetical protein